jgi:hypothetical protein
MKVPLSEKTGKRGNYFKGGIAYAHQIILVCGAIPDDFDISRGIGRVRFYAFKIANALIPSVTSVLDHSHM